MNPEDISVIYAEIKRWQGRIKPGAKCRSCNDIGFYLEPPQIIGTYPKGTKLSEMNITEPYLAPCSCKNKI